LKEAFEKVREGAGVEDLAAPVKQEMMDALTHHEEPNNRSDAQIMQEMHDDSADATIHKEPTAWEEEVNEVTFETGSRIGPDKRR
jgi:hypothetical protein